MASTTNPSSESDIIAVNNFTGFTGSYPSILLKQFPGGQYTPSAAEVPTGPNIEDATVNVPSPGNIVFNNVGGAKVDAQNNIITQLRGKQGS